MKTFFQIILFLFCYFNAVSQTYISGGVYTNTTWTLVNSPYIVVDTVVVFPGVTLTIEPGVEVRFADSIVLDVRQANLIAEGTQTDSIIFTSNSNSPVQGIWEGIYLHECPYSRFNFCQIIYAEKGIYNTQDYILFDTINVKNSVFSLNDVGLTNFWAHGINHIDSCKFLYNRIGIENEYNTEQVLINYCDISYSQSYAILGGIVSYSNISYNLNNTSDQVHYNHCTILNNFRGPERGIIKNSIIRDNTYGLGSPDVFRSGPSADSCIIVNNIVGIFGAEYVTNSRIDSNLSTGIYWCANIINCMIRNNGLGIDQIDSFATVAFNSVESNDTGIILRTSPDIYCNKICNNSIYDLVYVNSVNVIVQNNYWCTPDSLTTTSVIYDGYDNVTYGLVMFMPIDTVQCYLTAGTNESRNSVLSVINISPNPLTDESYIRFNHFMKSGLLRVYDQLGREVYTINDLSGNEIKLSAENFKPGIYFFQLISDNNQIANSSFMVIE